MGKFIQVRNALFDHMVNALLRTCEAGFGVAICVHEQRADLVVPRLQRVEIADVGQIAGNHTTNTAIGPGGVGASSRGGAAGHQLVFGKNVVTQNRTGRRNRAVGDRAWPDQAALAAEKNGFLMQHDTAWDIPDQGWCRLVALRGIVEMHKR